MAEQLATVHLTKEQVSVLYTLLQDADWRTGPYQSAVAEIERKLEEIMVSMGLMKRAYL